VFPALLAGITFAGVALFAAESLADNGGVDPQADRFDRIDGYVQRQLEASNIPGAAIAIVEGNQTVHAEGFGDDGNGNTVTPDTPFWIGSNTKSFTALAVMQLVDAGQVDLDAPVQRYLPDFQVADSAASSEITVRHLLNQTSGFSRASGVKPLLAERDETLEEAVFAMRTIELNRPPGEAYEYSNLNFVVLGLLVQRVSGEPWAQYVQRHIFDPLEMRESYTSLEDAKANGLTAVHGYWFGMPVATEPPYLEGLAPTGWLYSTANDMARYVAMYLRGGTAGDGARVLSEAGVETMLAPATNITSRQLQSHEFSFQYGQGWFVGAFGAADDARWHLGNLPAFTAWMVLLPDTDQAAVVLINAGSQFEIAGANGVMSRIPIGVVNILRGEDPPGGLSIAQFFVVFDTAVLVILAVQVWSLLRVLLPPAPSIEGTRAAALALVPLLWELGLGLLLLLAFPASLGATWPQAFRQLPDLSLVVLLVALLWIATGIVRIARLAFFRTRRPAEETAMRPEAPVAPGRSA
jgi:CubicO group peptidase (beta-lactamase class C family)